MPSKKIKKSFKGKGFGKSKSGNASPSNSKDSGYSKSQAEVIFALCEGEIEGLVDGDKSIFFDGTPVQNASGSYNVENWNKEFRTGTQNQEPMTAFGDFSVSETAVNQEVVNGFPVTRTINSNTISSIVVRLGFVLTKYDDKNVAKETGLSFKIYLKEGSGAFNLVVDERKTGRYSSLVEFEYEIPVNNQSGNIGSFAIQVERVTTTDTAENIQRQLHLRSIAGVTRANLRYSHTVTLGVKLDSEQFSSFPSETAVDLRGLIKIPIPTNATINTSDRGIDYTGAWDGNFKLSTIAHSDPAWHLYNILVNKRYGLGDNIEANDINRYSLYEISKYCNEFVPDGNGGSERRFSLNCVIQGEGDAAQIIDDLVSVFRGISFWNQQSLYFAADKPGTAIAQFTQADVEDGLFTYNRSGLKSRFSVAKVRWNDKTDGYKPKMEFVDYIPAIEKYGRKTVELTAFGATTPGQARRYGLAYLIGNDIQDESVSFKARTYAMMLYPGAIIKIFDSKYADTRYGGLVTDAAINWIDLDSPIAITQSSGNVISVTIDGTIHERTVTNAIGTHTRINVTPNFPSIPEPETNWIFSSSQLSPRLYTIVNRVPTDNELMHEILAIPYREDKYNAVDFDFALTIQPNSRQQIIADVPMPRSASLSGFDYDAVDKNDQTLVVEWEEPYVSNRPYEFIRGYTVEYTSDFKKWESTSVRSDITDLYVPNVPLGTYVARIATVDVFGNRSEWLYTNEFNLNYIGILPLLPTIKVGFQSVLCADINDRRIVSVIRDLSSQRFKIEFYEFEITSTNTYIISYTTTNTFIGAVSLDDTNYTDLIFSTGSNNITSVRIFADRDFVSVVNVNTSISVPSFNRVLNVAVRDNKLSLILDNYNSTNSLFYGLQYDSNTLTAATYSAYTKQYSTSTHNLMDVLTVTGNGFSELLYIYQVKSNRNLILRYVTSATRIIDVSSLLMSTSAITYERGCISDNSLFYFILRDDTVSVIGVYDLVKGLTRFYKLFPFVAKTAWNILGLFCKSKGLTIYWQNISTKEIAVWKLNIDQISISTKSAEYTINNTPLGIFASTDISWRVLQSHLIDFNQIGITYYNNASDLYYLTYSIDESTKTLLPQAQRFSYDINLVTQYYTSVIIRNAIYYVRHDYATKQNVLFNPVTKFTHNMIGADGLILHSVRRDRTSLNSLYGSEPWTYRIYFFDYLLDFWYMEFYSLAVATNTARITINNGSLQLTDIKPYLSKIKKVGRHISTMSFTEIDRALLYDRVTGKRWLETGH